MAFRTRNVTGAKGAVCPAGRLAGRQTPLRRLCLSACGMQRVVPSIVGAVMLVLLPSRGVAAIGNIHPLAIEIDASANLYPVSNPCSLPGFMNGDVAGSTRSPALGKSRS